ncbi:MAG TPA: CRISPR-associated endonuclease Cas2 [bacterium]|jgi:CRISPR-associated protein Cas2
MSPYLIAYDIGDPRRLARLHRYLKGEALALQYSVFFGRFTAAGIERLEDEIAARIDPKEDDVRIYPLPDDFQVWALGASAPLPEGIHFAPAERLLAAAEDDADARGSD